MHTRNFASGDVISQSQLMSQLEAISAEKTLDSHLQARVIFLDNISAFMLTMTWKISCCGFLWSPHSKIGIFSGRPKHTEQEIGIRVLDLESLLSTQLWTAVFPRNLDAIPLIAQCFRFKGHSPWHGAHKLFSLNSLIVLQAAHSDVILKKMKGNLDQLGTVTIEVHIFPEALEAFVRYFYTGHISHRDLKSYAPKLLTAAKRYGVRALQLVAERYIAKHVSRETALSTWELGVDHGSDIIKDSVLDILAKDVQEVPKLGEYRTFRSQKDPELLVGLFENLIGRIT